MAPADLLFNRQIRNRLPDRDAMIPDGKRGKQEGKNEDSQPDEWSQHQVGKPYFNEMLGRKIRSKDVQMNETERKSPICASGI